MQLETVLSNHKIDLHHLQQCYKEEEGNRIFLHVMEQTWLEFRRLMIARLDTDVVATARYSYRDLNVTEFWIKFGKAREH